MKAFGYHKNVRIKKKLVSFQLKKEINFTKKMPKNRGKEGSDDRLFGQEFMQRKIKEAVFDMSFLLERGYGEASSCELAGNRYKLNKRQQ